MVNWSGENNLTKNLSKYIPCPYETLINPFFKIKDNLDKVKRILLAYTKRSITIGYC